MSQASLSTGRINQKLRTRRALLNAAAELMQSQGNFTLEEVAEHASISRATAYRYFSDVNALKLAASLPKTKSPEELVAGLDDVVDRVIAVHDYLFDISQENEALFRAFLGAVMAETSTLTETKNLTMRGARRLPMVELALLPIKDKVSQAEYAMLICSLSTMVGFESYAVLNDVCKLDTSEARKSMHYAIRLMLAKWS